MYVYIYIDVYNQHLFGQEDISMYIYILHAWIYIYTCTFIPKYLQYILYKNRYTSNHPHMYVCVYIYIASYYM